MRACVCVWNSHLMALAPKKLQRLRHKKIAISGTSGSSQISEHSIPTPNVTEPEDQKSTTGSCSGFDSASVQGPTTQV